MFPVLFSIGPLSITTLGLFAFLSFFFGSFFIWRKAKQEHIEDSDIFDLIFISLIVGLIGGRVGYVISNMGNFGFSLYSWINPIGSHGFAWFGFLLGFMLGIKIVSDRKKWTFFEIADMSVVGIIVSQILLRIGQFFDSSFVGANSQLPWALPFPGFEGRQHPLSLYEIPFLIFLLWLVRYFDKHYRLYNWYRGSRGEAKPGFLWLSYLLWLIIFHIGLDFVFQRQTVLFFVSSRQLWLMGMLFLSLFWFWWQAGDSFDIWKLREKWFGKNDSSLSNTKLAARQVRLEANDQSKINNASSELLIGTVSQQHTIENVSLSSDVIQPASNQIKTSGRRFFRSKK